MNNQNYNQNQGQQMNQAPQQQEKIFVNGMRIERKQFQNGGSIDKVGICVADFIQFLQQHQGPSGWVNFDIKLSQNTGQPYAELNTWKPQQQEQQPQQPQQQYNQAPQQPQQMQQQPAPQYQAPQQQQQGQQRDTNFNG